MNAKLFMLALRIAVLNEWAKRVDVLPLPTATIDPKSPKRINMSWPWVPPPEFSDD